MPVKTEISPDKKLYKIHIDGRFDFSLHQEFREAYRHIKDAGAVIKVHLRRADYIDSSALGMLLLLNEHASSHQVKVVLSGASDTVKRVLEIASFDKIFTIEQ